MDIVGVASQIFVWSQVYGREGKSVEENLEDVLKDISSAGYDGVEYSTSIASSQEEANNLLSLLEKYNLKLAALSYGGVYHERSEAEKTIEETARLASFAASIGCPAISVNPASIGREKTDEELKVQGEYLNRMGAALKSMGMSLQIHNHTPAIINNARELRANCENTDKDLVGLCLDTHWVLRGGVDPLSLIKEYPDRIKSLHLRNSKDGVWTEAFGEGDIDHSKMNQLLIDIGFSGWLIVELAYEEKTVITRTLLQNASISREYVREVFSSE